MSWSGSSELIGIGAFSELTGLSIDALRHYHDVGILLPADIARTGYRRYRLEQARRARTIATLRAVEMPLADIETYLEAHDTPAAVAVLLSHRRRLRDAQRVAADRVERLDVFIEGVSQMNTTPPAGSDVRAALLEMFEAQQALGRQLFEQTRASRPDKFVFELPIDARPDGWEVGERLAHEFAGRLDEIVAEHGWPDRTLVGDDGAAAAWAIAQHADQDNERCERWLPLLERAVHQGVAPGLHYAALTDRVLLRRGDAQRYGTLVEPDGNSWRLRSEVEDPDNIDERRDAIGLPSVATWLASLPAPDTWYAGETARQ